MCHQPGRSSRHQCSHTVFSDQDHIVARLCCCNDDQWKWWSHCWQPWEYHRLFLLKHKTSHRYYISVVTSGSDGPIADNQESIAGYSYKKQGFAIISQWWPVEGVVPLTLLTTVRVSQVISVKTTRHWYYISVVTSGSDRPIADNWESVACNLWKTIAVCYIELLLSSTLFSKILWNIQGQNCSISPSINPKGVKYLPVPEYINNYDM